MYIKEVFIDEERQIYTARYTLAYTYARNVRCTIVYVYMLLGARKNEYQDF